MESIRQNIEFNTVRITDEAKEIREKAGIHRPSIFESFGIVRVIMFIYGRSLNPYLKAEVELKDTEEKYKYISHEVDLLIYSIEPIVAYLGVGEFNEILCGAGRVYLLDHLEFTNIW